MGNYCARITVHVFLLIVFPANSLFAESVPDLSEKESVSATNVSTTSTASKKVSLFQHASYPDAWTASQGSNRPILLYVSMSGCPHCVKMIDETYHAPMVEEMVSNSFETLHVNRHSHPTLVSNLKIKWYPTTVLVGANNKVLDVIEGYVDAKTFQKRLQLDLASSESSTQTR